MSLSTLTRHAVVLAGVLASTGVFAAEAAPCTAGAAVYEGSRSAVLADQALWQRSGMERLALLAQYEPHDSTVVQARQRYEQWRNGEAYAQEVSRVAAARGETLSAFASDSGCTPSR